MASKLLSLLFLFTVGGAYSQGELLEFLSNDKWFNEAKDKFWVQVSDDGEYYYFPGLGSEDYYLMDVEQEDAKGYFLTFGDGDGGEDCFEIRVLSQNSISVDHYQYCARSSSNPSLYSRNVIEESNMASPIYTKHLKWKSVNCYRGDCTYTFSTPQEGSITFQSIEYEGFNIFDNPFFQAKDEDSMFPEYEIKNSVKEQYFNISYIEDIRQIELSDDEEKVLIIVKISEI